MDLSRTDIRILKMLQQDCRQPIKDVAKAIGIPISTAYDKIKRMKKNGIIRSYSAVVDQEKVGLRTTAFILVSVDYQGKDFSQVDVAKSIGDLEGVTEAFVITGDWDLLLKVKAASIEDVGDFVVDKLRKVDGVGKTKTLSVFKKVKEGVELPL